MKRFRLLSIITIMLFVLSSGCSELYIENENEPDAQRALSGPDEVMNLAGSSFQTWHNAIQEYTSLALPMAAMADNVTSSWGSSGMRDMSNEPRINSWNNSKMYGYIGSTREQWKSSYEAINASNTVLQRLNEGMDFGTDGSDNALVEAFSYFSSGVSHGYLGLAFDKAHLIKWDETIAVTKLTGWEEVIEEALTLLDKAILICNSNTFVIPVSWVGGQSMTNIELAQLANSYAARILASSSRTKAHNETINWNRVLDYATNGLTFDFAPELGDAYGWYDEYFVYGRAGGWGRVDHRVINALDHSYPSRWPADNISWNTPSGNDPGPANSAYDARLLSDFQYLATNNFNPARGYYHFSHYRYRRYDGVVSTVWYGNAPKPSFLLWEVQLIKAEALLRTTGNSTAALAILNSPTGARKVRGLCADITETDSDIVLRYILDEKDIECYMTGAGISFYDMRRTDRLQPGTLLHFPVPAGDLEILNIPNYTITAEPDGINASMGDWKGWDE